MKKNLNYFIKYAILISLAVCIIPMGGCKLWDKIKSILASLQKGNYDVMLIDCKIVPSPYEDSSDKTKILDNKRKSKFLTDKTKEAIENYSKDKLLTNKRIKFKYKGIIDNNQDVQNFYNDFLDKNKIFKDKKAILKQICIDYKCNVVMWGFVMSTPEHKTVFIACLYRDNNTILSRSQPILFDDKSDDAKIESDINLAITDLIEESVKGNELAAENYNNDGICKLLINKIKNKLKKSID